MPHCKFVHVTCEKENDVEESVSNSKRREKKVPSRNNVEALKYQNTYPNGETCSTDTYGVIALNAVLYLCYFYAFCFNRVNVTSSTVMQL